MQTEGRDLRLQIVGTSVDILLKYRDFAEEGTDPESLLIKLQHPECESCGEPFRYKMDDLLFCYTCFWIVMEAKLGGLHRTIDDL